MKLNSYLFEKEFYLNSDLSLSFSISYVFINILNGILLYPIILPIFAIYYYCQPLIADMAALRMDTDDNGNDTSIRSLHSNSVGRTQKPTSRR